MSDYITVQHKNMRGKIATDGQPLWYKDSVINGFYRDLAAEGQPDVVKRYIRLLIKQFEGF